MLGGIMGLTYGTMDQTAKEGGKNDPAQMFQQIMQQLTPSDRTYAPMDDLKGAQDFDFFMI
jgi:hypothetical protein